MCERCLWSQYAASWRRPKSCDVLQDVVNLDVYNTIIESA